MNLYKYALLTAAACGIASAAETAYTAPVGYVTVSAAAGNGTTRTVSVLSIPMVYSETITGAAVGRITGVTANSISNSSAGWSAGELSVPAFPYIIRITSGAAVGHTFLISTVTANTATTATIDTEEAAKVDLTTLGIVTGASGDTYAIYTGDTLSGVFGTPATTGIQGGTATNGNGADIVQMSVAGSWRQYYYNTTSASWRRIGPNTLSNDVPIRPDSAVIYSRLAASVLNLTCIGTVPTTDRKALVNNSGVSFLSGSWPVGLTLATSAIQSTPGWVSTPTYSATTSDIVQMAVGGAWIKYYHTGTNWKRVGPNTISDTVAIPTGSAFIIQKAGTSPGVTTLSQVLPYNLQ